MTRPALGRAGRADLHDRPDEPGRELVLADAPLLAQRLAARRDLEDELEQLVADLVDRSRAVHHASRVDVHVVAHPLVQRGVARDLDGRTWLAAEHRAAPG